MINNQTIDWSHIIVERWWCRNRSLWRNNLIWFSTFKKKTFLFYITAAARTVTLLERDSEKSPKLARSGNRYLCSSQWTKKSIVFSGHCCVGLLPYHRLPDGCFLLSRYSLCIIRPSPAPSTVFHTILASELCIFTSFSQFPVSYFKFQPAIYIIIDSGI